jgi:hypothetical protein
MTMKRTGTASASARHCFPEAPEQWSAMIGERVFDGLRPANASMFDMATFSSGPMRPSYLENGLR